MMSARLLRAGDAGGDHDAARSRRGFYAWIDWSYTGMLAFSMRFGFLVALVALCGHRSSSVPLYKVLKQEYIPSDVDEAEFEVAVTAPEGISLAAMDEVMQAVSAELRSIPGVTLVMANSGSSFLGSVNVGNAYVRIAPHEGRTFSLTRLWHALWAGDPGQAFRGNYTQREMILEVRRRLKSSVTCVPRRAISRRLTSVPGILKSTSLSAVPTSRRCQPMPSNCAPSPRPWAWWTLTPRSSSTSLNSVWRSTGPAPLT